jgi:hypothetical protein
MERRGVDSLVGAQQLLGFLHRLGSADGMCADLLTQKFTEAATQHFPDARPGVAPAPGVEKERRDSARQYAACDQVSRVGATAAAQAPAEQAGGSRRGDWERGDAAERASQRSERGLCFHRPSRLERCQWIAYGTMQ